MRSKLSVAQLPERLVHVGRQWTSRELSDLARMRAEGHTWKQVAEQMPERTVGACRRAAVRFGIARKRRPWTGPELERIRRMRARGERVVVIAEVLGRSRTEIEAVIRRV